MSNKIKISLLLLFIVIFTGSLWLFSNQKPRVLLSPPPSTIISSENKIKAMVLKPRALRKNKNSQNLPYEACLNLWQDVDSLDLSASEEEIISMVNAFDFSVCKTSDQNLIDLQKGVIEACFKPTKKNSFACKQALIFYRSATHIDKTTKLSEISDFPTLVDMLINLFSAKDLDIKKMREIALKMKELEGDIPLVQKLSIITESINAIAYDKSKNTPELWEKLSNDFDQLDEKIKADPQMTDFKILVATEGMKPQKVIEWANEAITSGENKIKGFELRGYINWKNGNRAQAISDLENAIRLDPNNTSYPQVLKKISSRDAGINDYTITAKLGFSFDELFDFNR